MQPKPGSRRRRRGARAAALAFLAMALLAGCSAGGSNFGSPHGVTKQSANALHDWRGTFLVALILGGIVAGLIIWCMIRYRRKPTDTGLPRQFQYHIPIELAYTIIPVIIVSVVFGFMYVYENNIDKVSKHPAVEVRVDAFQWGWKFTYEKTGYQIAGNINHFPTLVIPSNETVQLDLYSDDVNHSFYVPEFLFKRDIIQGVHNVIDVTVDKNGTWPGQCTQLCGVYHALMKFYVQAVPPKQFNSWLATQSAALGHSSSTGA